MRHAKPGHHAPSRRSAPGDLHGEPRPYGRGHRPARPGRFASRAGRATGATLVELAVVLTLIGILAALALPPLGRRRDRMAVHHAAQLLTDALAVARDAALAGAAPVAVRLDGPGATITVHSASDTIERRALGAMLGVALHATRDSMAYGPDGLGIGAANLTAVIERGSAADTLVVSRLGRIR